MTCSFYPHSTVNKLRAKCVFHTRRHDKKKKDATATTCNDTKIIANRNRNNRVEEQRHRSLKHAHTTHQTDRLWT